MYLKRVTITGFKSFAAKTVLDLEPGITAVVGPNGSGKSNLADAVRWALGEQSKGRLRLNDREEVVFAGTERRARASLAEVTLLFDNQDGAFPVEMTEVEVSRRLYRSGETDYRLAGRSVRLGDIQQLLAEAGFGTNTYAVIGQGMIDTFLLSSPTERKLLFDEAAGIRATELKREAALRKLTATAGNLTRLRDIHSELVPRLASLERGLAAAQEVRAPEQQRTVVRQELVWAAQKQIGGRLDALSHQQREVARQLHRLRHERARLEQLQKQRLAAAQAAEAGRVERTAQLQALETDHNRRLEAVASLRGQRDQLALSLGRADELAAREAAIVSDLATAQTRAAELLEELAANQAAADRAARAVERADQVVTKVQRQLVELRRAAADGTQQQYVAHALTLLKSVARGLTEDMPLEHIRLLVHKTGRLLSHAIKTGEAEQLQQLRGVQARLEAAMTRRETAGEHQTNIVISRRSLEIDLAHQEAAVQRLEEKLDDVRAELGRLDQQREQLAVLARQITGADHALEKLTGELTRCRAERQQRTDHSALAEVAEAAAALERLRSQQAAATTELAALRQEHAHLQAELHRYGRQAREWGLELAELSDSRATAINLADHERQLLRLDAELTARQQLEHDTAAEYAEVNQRNDDLITQIADLEQAEADLRRLVTELDGLVQQRFRQNFEALAKQFSAYFTRLFGGGAASLELQEQDDGQYGILIKATPKGKRLANLMALSGGERAMAGVALLAAILSVNPSPFVVLDEIDAALDEANSGRLAAILEELADRSQLIVITHNRQTMKAAKVLFGVTMNEHHVSHLLSLHLEEASALAAR